MTAARVPGKYERLWAERHARDLALCAQPGGHPRGLRWSPSAGARAVQFIEGLCTHHKGEWAGRPLILNDIQREIFTQVFGWLRADGTRRYRTAYVEVARKFGKSTIAGGLGLFMLVADGEQGAEVYSSATKKDQAAIVWKDAAAMVKASAKLKRFVKVQRNNLSCERMGSKFEPLSADSSTMDGLNPSCNLVDELHAHKDRGVWDVLDTAMGARRQPLTLAITTAGKYDPESIGWQMHDYAQKVLEGVIEDDSFFAFIAAADEPPKGQEGYYFTEAALRQANPGYGVSPKADYLSKQAEKAQNQPSFLNTYKQLHLNIWTETVTRWLSLENWAACESVELNHAASLEREKTLEGLVCFGGLDLSSKLDLSAFVLVFPGAGDSIDVLCRFWLPENTMAQYSKKKQNHYATWARDGWLSVTPGDVIDYDFIRAEIRALCGGVDDKGATVPARFKMKELAFDPWGATQLATQLMAEGHQLTEVRQGYKSLSEPSKDLEAKTVSKKVRHASNPVLRFCAANAVVTTDSAGNIKPDKEKAVGRIDGIVATVMALSRFVNAPPPETGSYLDSGGVMVLG